MDSTKIARINALAKKAKEQGLSAAETAEQAKLRTEYAASVKQSLQTAIDHTVIQEPDGTRHPVKKRGAGRR